MQQLAKAMSSLSLTMLLSMAVDAELSLMLRDAGGKTKSKPNPLEIQIRPLVVETRGSNDFRPLDCFRFTFAKWFLPSFFFRFSFIASRIFRSFSNFPEAECCVRLQRRVVAPLQCWEAALCSAERSSEPSQRRRRPVSSRSFSWTSMPFSQVFRNSSCGINPR